MAKKNVIVIKSADIKTRKPVQKKCNSVMKSKKTYNRKTKHKECSKCQDTTDVS